MRNINRRAARIDNNQTDIVKSLKAIPGVSVDVGHSDILVGRNGQTYWFEIKQSPLSKLKDSQVRIKANFTGHYMIVWSLEQILDEIGITKKANPYITEVE